MKAILEAFRDPDVLAWILFYVSLMPVCAGAFGLAIVGPELWRIKGETDVQDY